MSICLYTRSDSETAVLVGAALEELQLSPLADEVTGPVRCLMFTWSPTTWDALLVRLSAVLPQAPFQLGAIPSEMPSNGKDQPIYAWNRPSDDGQWMCSTVISRDGIPRDYTFPPDPELFGEWNPDDPL